MKVKRLVFGSTKDDKETATMLYRGFLLGGNIVNGNHAKGPEVTRRESRILDKFDALGECDDENAVMNLYDEGGELVLDIPQFEMLKKYFNSTPWTVRVSRKVEQIDDWLTNIQPEEG